jgi:hypothetical protein
LLQKSVAGAGVRQIADVLDRFVGSLPAPSIDPVLSRMLIIGLRVRDPLGAGVVPLNFAYRWFCGLSIEDKIPDHSAFSRARNDRFPESDIFRRVFERVVRAC